MLRLKGLGHHSGAVGQPLYAWVFLEAPILFIYFFSWRNFSVLSPTLQWDVIHGA